MAMAGLLAGLVCLGLLATPSAAINPVTRVVEMMEGLVKKVESDGKADEDSYEAYVCWYKTVTSTKKASNAAAADRIENLNAYIDDVQSGRVEFTSERKDLEAAIAGLQKDIEAATNMRKKENEDFLAAKDEMEKGIAALEKAVDVLGDATKDAKEGVLMAYGFDLRRAVDMAKSSSSMSAQDLQFLEQALDGKQPEDKDWEKLNRKAVFKMKYKARSGKIQEILADMLQSFKDNLADAEAKEEQDKTTSETLLENKNSELSAAQDALTEGAGENGMRGLAVDEAKDEVKALTDQVKADEGYISQAEEAFATKKDEWKEIKRLRSEEVAAIENAIAILTSDEARDTMSKSFKSQTKNLFLQDQNTACMQKRAKAAAAHVRKLAKKHKDVRLGALALSMSLRAKAKGHFDAVVKGIEEVISDLHKENDMDLKVKEDCENDRNKNTKTTKNMAYEIDTQTALIVRKNAEIDAKNKEIDRLTAEKKDLLLQREEAQVNRNKENAEYKVSKSDDETAVSLIVKAKDALGKFYQDNGLALAQQGAKAKMDPVAAGAAPPPPPSTWSEPYGGAKGESNNIVSIMEMIKADVEKDIKTATEVEETSQTDFDNFMADTEAQLKSIAEDVAQLEGEIGDAEMAIKDARSTRKEKKGIMEESMMFLRSIAEGCDFMAKNFELRKANREEETDGLLESQAMLTGAGKGSFGFVQC